MALEEKVTKRPSPLIPGGKPLFWLGRLPALPTCRLADQLRGDQLEIARVHLIDVSLQRRRDQVARVGAVSGEEAVEVDGGGLAAPFGAEAARGLAEELDAVDLGGGRAGAQDGDDGHADCRQALISPPGRSARILHIFYAPHPAQRAAVSLN